MFRNYLTVAIRAFLNRKLYSFINVAGLAVSLCCAIFIALYIQSQISVDGWEEGSNSVYQVTTKWTVPGYSIGHKPYTKSAQPFAPAAQADLPEVTAYARTSEMKYTVKAGGRQFTTDMVITDPNFFSLIRLPFLRGNAKDALKSPDMAVLSHSAALKFFGRSDVVGRTLTVDGKYSFRISAVLQPRPQDQTKFLGDMYISQAGGLGREAVKNKLHNWGDATGESYIRLTNGADPAAVVAKFPGIVRRHCDINKFIKKSLSSDHYLHYGLVQLKNIHIDAPEGKVDGSGRTMVRGFAAIALLILIIASVNFTNLSTAIAAMRAREVGLRKTVGARRGQLMAQFLAESVLTALIALIFALVLTEVLLPLFNSFLGSHIRFSYLQDFPVLALAFVLALFCGLAGGLYPAVVLSGFRPSMVLKSGHGSAQGSGRLRNTLVVGQFAISIGLGIIALGVFSQINYARKIDLGFHRDNVVYIANAGDLSTAKRQTLIHRLAADPAIRVAASSDYRPFGGLSRGIPVIAPQTGNQISGRVLSTDPNYAKVFGLKLLAGRSFDYQHGADEMSGITNSAELNSGHNVMIDASMADAMGLTPREAVGKVITAGGNNVRVRIIGVYATVKMMGFAATPKPALYRYIPDLQEIVSVRLKTGHIHEGLKAIDHTWHTMAPNSVIQRHFTDQDYDAEFESLDKQAGLFTVFVIIALFTASMGLFGVAAFTAERKKKEISIRKVFGASKAQIIRLLLWRFSIPVLIANVIAWPVAYLWLHHWLEGYAYHIALSPLYFLLSGAIALFIATVTISANAWQTASVPPAHALRTE